MPRQLRAPLTLLLAVLTATSGCQPIQPFYLHEDGDLSHYLDSATEIESPDVFEPMLAEVEFTQQPLTISNPEHDEVWDLSLEDSISICLNNSKVIRNLGGVTPFGFSDALVGRIATGSTVYDTALVEADPQNGVEAALSAFDAQLSVIGSNNGNFATQTDRPSTFQPNSVIKRQLGGLRTELSKRTATGMQLFVRNQTDYSRGDNLLGANQPTDSIWETFFEVEARQPLLRGRGAQLNRIPVILARINTDVSLATFEASMRNLVADLENTYWDLYCAYRQLDTAIAGRDASQVTWNNVSVQREEGTRGTQEEAQAREQYFFFRVQVEQALSQLFDQENRLRFLMGLSPSDGRLIRPKDEPTVAQVEFDWRASHMEALTRSAELRQQKWVLKRRELELISARNLLLPQLDVGVAYRWFGAGDHLMNADRNGIDFVATDPNPQNGGLTPPGAPVGTPFGQNPQFLRNPADPRGPVGSTAFDVLTDGHYQEASFFLSFQMPVGYRRELAGVRAAQISLAREKARLEDMELNITHLLTSSYRQLDTTYRTAQSNFNRWQAASEEVVTATELYKTGIQAIDVVLDAQRRRAQAQNDFQRALCDYNKAIADVHFRKGSLLEYNSIYLAEGPWPEKACWDALGQARERDASYYLNYGSTRPGVISTGAVSQQQGTAITGDAPIVVEPVPTPAPTVDPAPGNNDRSREAGPITDLPDGPTLNAPRRAAIDGDRDAVASEESRFDWGSLGFDTAAKPVGTAVHAASYEK